MLVLDHAAHAEGQSNQWHSREEPPAAVLWAYAPKAYCIDTGSGMDAPFGSLSAGDEGLYVWF